MMQANGNAPIRVLELRSVRGTGGGPEKTILLGTARTSRDRFDITVCYVRDDRDGVFAIDEWARTLGVDYVEIRERHSFDVRAWSAIRSLVRDRGIDIVHAHEYKTDLAALMLGRAEGVVPLATVHGWTGHSWKERRVYYPADRWILARFPHLIAVSEQIRETLIAAGARPERVTTVLNSIDPASFRRDRTRERPARANLALPADAIILGAVGRLEPQKRFDLLLDVLASLQLDEPDLHLAIAGDGSLKPALETQIEKLGIGGRAHLLGHRADVTELHHAFDIFVQSSDYEGTPNAVLEAMALETPIVATDVGGTREIAHHDVHALIVPPRDPAALAAAIRRLVADPTTARSLADAARRRVETDLSFGTRMARVEAIYDALMAERRSRRRRAS